MTIAQRPFVQLSVVILIGWGVGQLLQQTAPLGRDLSANAMVKELLRDTSSPSREVGNPTLTLVVFADYQCAACKRAYPAMTAAVERDGRIRIVFKELPIFGARSEQAARIALAADRQGIYTAAHHYLMKDRRPLTEHVMREAVEKSGGNWSQIQADLRINGSKIDRQINLNRWDAFKLGIAGTPAYLAGTLLVVGGLDEGEFTEAFALGRTARRLQPVQ